MSFYPFGMGMPARSFNAGSASYIFGYQGSLKDSELNENSYSTFYRELDTRLAIWRNIDPKLDATETPYSLNHNNPIKYNDPLGDWPPVSDGNVYGQVSLQLNLGGNSSSNMRFTAAIGGSAKYGAIQGDFSASLNLNLGGIGSTQGNTGNLEPVADFNVSGGVTGGVGSAPLMTMNIYHNMSGNNVNTTYAGSASVGLTQTFSSMMFSQPGRDQATGYAYLRGGPFSLGNYNDLFAKEFFGLPQNDSYYTGGFEIQVQMGDYSKVTAGYDAFTGVRPGNPSSNWQIGPDGHPYFNQPASEQIYNNGQTTLRLTTKTTVIGINHVGNGMINGLWLQNLIHDNWKEKELDGTKCSAPKGRFLNTSHESFQLSISQYYGGLSLEAGQ